MQDLTGTLHRMLMVVCDDVHHRACRAAGIMPIHVDHRLTSDGLDERFCALRIRLPVDDDCKNGLVHEVLLSLRCWANSLGHALCESAPIHGFLHSFPRIPTETIARERVWGKALQCLFVGICTLPRSDLGIYKDPPNGGSLFSIWGLGQTRALLPFIDRGGRHLRQR